MHSVRCQLSNHQQFNDSMSSLDYSFGIFKALGIWRPKTWESGWKYYLYNLYTIIAIMPVFTLTLLEIVTMIMSFDNIEKLISSCTMLFAIFNVCGKITTMLVHRERIFQLLDIQTHGFFHGENPEEEATLEKINKTIRFRSKLFIWIKVTALGAMLYMTLIISIPQKIVWLDIWVPFHFSTNTQFIFMLIYEISGHYIAAIVAMAYDILVPGMMLQISGQLNLLQYRIHTSLSSVEIQTLQNSKFGDRNGDDTERMMISGWIRHHLLIYQFAAELSRIFSPLIFIQYSTSMILLCVNIYVLARVPLFSPPFIRTLLFNAILFSQIFLLCFVGTEVMDHSSFFCRSIYQTHWYMLSHSNKKSINMMMTRSLKPIKFTSAGLIETSLESFVRLVKISYSAYNCLQRLSHDE